MAPEVRCHPEVNLRLALEEARRQGLDFDAAWTDAWSRIDWPTDSALRRDWRDALTETQDEWRSAYDRTPATPTTRAYGALLLKLPLTDEPPATHEDTRGRRRGLLVA